MRIISSGQKKTAGAVKRPRQNVDDQFFSMFQ
jgi:hypothetical protein